MANELDKAFEALAAFDWGKDINALKPIDDAVISTHEDAAARKELEKRLVSALTPKASRAAKDYICRKLMLIGTAESVPVLAALLRNKDDSHMARYALEQISAKEAAVALRLALPKLDGELKIGVISSIGARRDAVCVSLLVGTMKNKNPAIAVAAACALGRIGTPDAAEALLQSANTAPDAVKSAVIDACLVCAEQLLADGKKSNAVAVYKKLGAENQPKLVRMAAKRGLLNALKKSS